MPSFDQTDQREVDWRIQKAAEEAATKALRDQLENLCGGVSEFRTMFYTLRGLDAATISELKEALKWIEEQKKDDEERKSEQRKSVYNTISTIIASVVIGLGSALALMFGWGKSH